MPVNPVLLHLANTDTLTAEELLEAARPSQLVDDLDVADELAALERLAPEHRLDDLARAFRRTVVAHHTAPSDATRELVAGLYLLGRRTLTELRIAADTGLALVDPDA